MKLRLFLPLLLASTAALAEPGTALKSDALRAEPFNDAKTIGNLNRGDKLDIITKQGAWLKVKAGKNTGWVRLLSVTRGTVSSNNTGANATGVLNVASGRAGTGNVVATTGVRGLNEEELKAAKFNAQEMQKLESYAANKQQAQEFASAGGLTARKLKYLPDPANGGKP